MMAGMNMIEVQAGGGNGSKRLPGGAVRGLLAAVYGSKAGEEEQEDDDEEDRGAETGLSG